MVAHRFTESDNWLVISKPFRPGKIIGADIDHFDVFKGLQRPVCKFFLNQITWNKCGTGTKNGCLELGGKMIEFDTGSQLVI